MRVLIDAFVDNARVKSHLKNAIVFMVGKYQI